MIVFAVTGSRNYDDPETVDREMRRWVTPGDSSAIVIEGGAPGLDRQVRRWCEKNGVHFAEVPALWEWMGRAAGPVRNGVMLLLRPDFVLAFPGGTGTADMCRQAKAAGIEVRPISAAVTG